jgi:hypothetical protein
MPPKTATQEADRFPPLAPQEDRPRPAAPKSGPKPKRSLAWQDKVAIFFALATISMIAYVALLISNPYTPLNFFAPPTPMPLLITATPGPTLPPTSSPAPTHEPTLTPVPTGTFTPIPAGSLTNFTFALADAGVIYVANSAERGGCNWSSIAGSVTDRQGQGLDGYGIHISGDGVDNTVFSGPTSAYGPGGFELPLNGAPKQAQYTVQLLSPDNQPVSEAYPIATHDQCDQNIAVVSFVQVA